MVLIIFEVDLFLSIIKTEYNMAILKPCKFKISQPFWNDLIDKWVHIYQKVWLKGHEWVDFATPVNTPLLAWFDGKIAISNEWKNGYGLAVWLQKPREWGWYSQIIYGHLNSTPFKWGETVKEWQIIGYSWGSSSSPTSWTSTWAHLHFGLRFKDSKWVVTGQDNGYKGYVDPTPYFK